MGIIITIQKVYLSIAKQKRKHVIQIRLRNVIGIVWLDIKIGKVIFVNFYPELLGFRQNQKNTSSIMNLSTRSEAEFT